MSSVTPLGIALATVLVACGDDGAAPATTSSAPGAGGGATSSSDAAAGGGSGTGGAEGSTATTGSSGGQGGDGGQGGGQGPPAPEVYRGGRTHSPITPFVAERLRAIAAAAPSARPDVFMKVGASSTASRNTLFCFADGPVALGEHGGLEDTLAFFLGGDAAGTTPFDRESAAAESGRSAAWAIAGDPSPLDVERAALAPSLALVHYGTNDMGGGATFEAALVAFHASMSTLLEQLVEGGVVPVVFGITRREDDPAADRWVAAFNGALRGMAQRAQVPFVDLHHAIDPLPGHGLGADGLHLEAYEGGACVLDEAGLQHGYNVRNLVALQALDRLRAVLVGGASSIDAPAASVVGAGTSADPWQIDAVPFAHAASTLSGDREVDVYPACSDADESGPEVWYRLELDAPARLRIVVLDRDAVDVDVHLVGPTPSGDGCVARGHHLVEASLDAGVHHLAVDTFVDAGGERSGDFLLVIVACDADDPSCDG